MFFAAEDYMNGGHTKLAVKAYQAALKEATKDDIEEFVALNYLGESYLEDGRENKALETFKRCQDMSLRIFGGNSNRHAVSLANEGLVHFTKGRAREAEPLFDKALEIMRSPERSAHKECDEDLVACDVVIYGNAGACKAELGDFGAALRLFQESYRSAVKVLPLAHPRRMQSAFELGVLSMALGLQRDGETLKKELLKAAKESGGSPVEISFSFNMAVMNVTDCLNKFDFAWGGLQGFFEEKSSQSNVVPLFAEAMRADAGYQLKITLRRVKPALWRRIAVPADFTVGELHTSIQRAMGWSDSHLHEFRIKGSRLSDPKNVPGTRNEESTKLTDFRFEVGDKFEYDYDFGDGWEHSIVVEKVFGEEEFDASKFFIAGKGACPPEDCGGPYSFMNLLAALKDPTVRRSQLPGWLEKYEPDELPLCFGVKPNVKKPVKKSEKMSAEKKVAPKAKKTAAKKTKSTS